MERAGGEADKTEGEQQKRAKEKRRGGNEYIGREGNTTQIVPSCLLL